MPGSRKGPLLLAVVASPRWVLLQEPQRGWSRLPRARGSLETGKNLMPLTHFSRKLPFARAPSREVLRCATRGRRWPRSLRDGQVRALRLWSGEPDGSSIPGALWKLQLVYMQCGCSRVLLQACSLRQVLMFLMKSCLLYSSPQKSSELSPTSISAIMKLYYWLSS